MPRPTIIRLMLLVAVVAGTLGAGGECMRRRSRFLSHASTHAAEACDGRVVSPSRRAAMSGAELAASSVRRLAWEEYHAGLAVKYARAARLPWLAAAPDPPEPE